MPVPCYGCGQTLRVDNRWPEQGLLLAGWTLAGGETYCRARATARGYGDPRGFAAAGGSADAGDFAAAGGSANAGDFARPRGSDQLSAATSASSSGAGPADGPPQGIAIADPATSAAVVAIHPGPGLFPTRPLRPGELDAYQRGLTKLDAMAAISPPERRAALARAHERSELRLIVGWGCLGLLTISRPSTLAWITVAVESVIWGIAVLRLRLARERVLGEADEIADA